MHVTVERERDKERKTVCVWQMFVEVNNAEQSDTEGRQVGEVRRGG